MAFFHTTAVYVKNSSILFLWKVIWTLARRCAEEFVSGRPLGIMRVNWFKTAGVYWTKSVCRID